eukprot:SAG31_NODE_3071_length_4718_cov_3.180342_3_plen_148_part_00
MRRLQRGQKSTAACNIAASELATCGADFALLWSIIAAHSTTNTYRMDQTAASFNSALASSNCSDDKAEHSAGAEDAAGPNWERNRKKRAAKKRAQQRKLQLQEAQWACSTACGSTVVESPEPITNTPQTAKQRLQQKLACRQVAITH